jgi:hypothetical protein
MVKHFRKILALLLVLAVVASLKPMTASAAKSSDYVSVTRRDSYNKNGNYYMVFYLSSYTSKPLYVWGKSFNSAGKAVFTSNLLTLDAYSSGVTWSWGENYIALPAGKYTFKFYVSLSKTKFDGWYWSYTITVPEKPTFSYKSYEKVLIDGKLTNKFNIQCTNMKGQKLTLKIYDPYGDLVHLSEGPARKTNNEVGWFSWSGYNTVGERYRCPSGEYTLIITATGSSKVVEKTVNLKILEQVGG